MAFLDRSRRAPLLLALLAPTVAELMTGSTPVATIVFDPPGFLVSFAGLVLLYGGGALLVREAAVRWVKGWPTVLALGAAYGVVEEGLAVHTFFLSSGGAVGALAVYGRWGGVNTVWAVGLTLFHATYSIALPILLVSLAYPEFRSVRFLEGRWLPAVVAGYVGIVLVFALVEPAFPPASLLVAALAAVAGLVALGRWAPRTLGAAAPGGPVPPAWWLFGAGTAPFLLWLVAGTGAPSLFPAPWEAITALLAGNLLVGVGIVRATDPAHADRNLAWVALGMVSVLTAWTFLLELAGALGVALVGAGVLLLTLRVTRPYRRTDRPNGPGPPSAAGPR